MERERERGACFPAKGETQLLGPFSFIRPSVAKGAKNNVAYKRSLERGKGLVPLLTTNKAPLSRGQADGEKGPPRTRKAASKRKKRPFGLGEGRERSFSTTTTSAARGIAEEDRERDPGLKVTSTVAKRERGGKRKRKKARRPFEESGGDRQGRSIFFLSLYPSPASARLELSAASSPPTDLARRTCIDRWHFQSTVCARSNGQVRGANKVS